jgi:hypothetical protein
LAFVSAPQVLLDSGVGGAGVDEGQARVNRFVVIGDWGLPFLFLANAVRAVAAPAAKPGPEDLAAAAARANPADISECRMEIAYPTAFTKFNVQLGCHDSPFYLLAR